MLTVVRTDKNIQGHELMTHSVTQMVESGLARFADEVTRIEVYLSDENSSKGGKDDKRCVLEARVEGIKPIAVTHRAATVADSISGATRKMARALDTTLEKRRGHTA